MSEQWKPGQVAMTRYSHNGKEQIAIVGRSKHVNLDGPHFIYGDAGYDFVDSRSIDARPLVVIDPDDREQVERLLRAWYECTYSSQALLDKIPRMQAALREFANPTPPKPAEPTGLGAVVEDVDGRCWSRVLKASATPWGEVGDLRWRTYADIAAVRVLSEGVRDV